MTYEWMTWLPDVLRSAGLTVVEHDGWATRGLSQTKPFEVRGVVVHHDASPVGDSPSVPANMIRNFETAAAQAWVARDGAWHVIAAGRAPHAGPVLSQYVGLFDNYSALGVETDHTVGEVWPDAQLTALRTGIAAVLAHKGLGADRVNFHRIVCDPPGRKIDPVGLNLTDERAKVGSILALTAPTSVTQVVNHTYTMRRGDTIWTAARALGIGTAAGVAAILAVNHIDNPNGVVAGTVVTAPATVTVTAPAPQPPVVAPPVAPAPRPPVVAPPVVPAPVVVTTTLRYGSTGPAVHAYEVCLNRRGLLPRRYVDNYFGTLTVNGTNYVIRHNPGLGKADGVAGPKTQRTACR